MAPKHIAIDLPGTLSEWRKMAGNETIPAPSDARLKAMTAEEQVALHIGEHPINLSLRDLSGWPSASAMTRAHFLTTRILWKFVTRDELDKKLIDKFPKTLTSCVETHFKDNDLDFTLYLNDLDLRGGIQPPAGEATYLGKYTSIRHEQLAIRALPIAAPTAITSPPGGTRSHGGPVVPGLDGPADDDDSGEDEISSLSTAERTHSSASLHEVISRHSDTSALTPDEWSRSEGEDQVNVALVGFLSTLAMTCKRAKLDWTHLKKRFDFSLGHANIRSINDGSLRARHTGDILAILEVKPIRLIEKGQATLMQMGLEMMTHILDCEEKKRAKKRYWMLSQHFDEIYFTWAEIEDGYITYLLHGHGGHDTLSFLRLKFAGPFEIGKAGDMAKLSHLVLFLTVQESDDFTAHISRPYLGTENQEEAS